MRPFPVTDASIHMDMLTRVGPAGNYLKEKHMLLHLREALWSSKLLLREGFVEGHPNEERVRERARARVRGLLANHEVAPLDVEVRRRIWELARPLGGT
jgi:trimethylamine:corrinoid methyltransferase-like protein